MRRAQYRAHGRKIDTEAGYKFHEEGSGNYRFRSTGEIITVRRTSETRIPSLMTGKGFASTQVSQLKYGLATCYIGVKQCSLQINAVQRDHVGVSSLMALSSSNLR